MKKYMNVLSLAAFSIGTGFTLTSCDVDKVEDGEMPEVKVEGEVKLPDYNVEGPEVTTGTKKVEIEVPTVDVDLPDEEDTAEE